MPPSWRTKVKGLFRNKINYARLHCSSRDDRDLGKPSYSKNRRKRILISSPLRPESHPAQDPATKEHNERIERGKEDMHKGSKFFLFCLE